MSRPNPFAWRWAGGLCVPRAAAADLAALARLVLADPRDDTARLVLADRVEEVGAEGCDRAAARLRTAPGSWRVGGALGRRHLGLTWWAEPVAFGVVVALVARPLLPACRRGHRPDVEPGDGCAVLWHTPDGWECRACRWPASYAPKGGRVSRRAAGAGPGR